MSLYKKPFENFVGKGENASLFCRLHMLSIWTSLKFCRLVMINEKEKMLFTSILSLFLLQDLPNLVDKTLYYTMPTFDDSEKE